MSLANVATVTALEVVCLGCGRLMAPRTQGRPVCSMACYQRDWRRRRREVRRHWCQCCHREFSPIRRDAKWCSGPCRWKAYRRRTAARAVEAEREREAAARALERERERARIAQEAARRREDFIASLIG